MQSVTLGYDEGGSLTLANPKRGEFPELWWITATVEQHGVRASTQVESHYARLFRRSRGVSRRLGQCLARLGRDEDLRVAELGIPYALGGSMASSLVGEPRSTVDVDIAVKLEREAGAALLERANAEFYVLVEAALTAIHRHSSFNLVDTAHG